ncbi:MAG TPA: FG-GAP-like repeat-containing protein, partial [Candidatus Thermoplasmatota archaeon]|nr:FG-GAP-like repeat-containing protein [Candidatus Thermoplasmatota archaeon]
MATLVAPMGGAATTQIRELSNATANESVWMKAFDAPAAAVGDFDGDGHAEIVAHNDNQYVYVLSTKEARVLAEFKPPYPSGWGARPLNDPAVADVDNDGRLEIVVATSAAYVCVYEYDPSQSTATSFKFLQVWCKRMDTYDPTEAGADAGVWVEDVTGDGKAEIFSQTEEQGLFCFNYDGTVRWSTSDWGGNAGPTVADLNGDGKKEAVFFGDGGEVKAFDAATGVAKWTFYSNKHVWPASIPVSGAVGDLETDGKKEIVFIARQATHTDDYRKNHFMLFVLNHDGTLRWKAQPTWGNPLSYTHPIIHDVDGDGKKEIIAEDWNTIGHKPGAWEKLGPANVFAYNADGTLRWRTTFDASWSNDDLALADVDGDGHQDVLAIGFAGGTEGVWYLDARNGVQKQHIPIYGWTPLRGVIAGDFDKSGDTEFAVPVHKTDKGGGYVFFDTGVACNIAFGGWQNPTPCSPRTGSSS